MTYGPRANEWSVLRRTRMVPSRKTKAALGRHEWLRMANRGKSPNPAVVLNELHRFAPWLPGSPSCNPQPISLRFCSGCAVRRREKRGCSADAPVDVNDARQANRLVLANPCLLRHARQHTRHACITTPPSASSPVAENRELDEQWKGLCMRGAHPFAHWQGRRGSWRPGGPSACPTDFP